MAAVRTACRDALKSRPAPAFFAAAREYLVYIMQRFLAQDAAHIVRLRAVMPATDREAERVLEDLARALAGLRSALAPLESGADATSACREFVTFFDAQLSPQRHVLAPLIDRHYTLADWRAVSFVDADNILEEGRRFEAVRAALPPGVSLDVARPVVAAAG